MVRWRRSAGRLDSKATYPRSSSSSGKTRNFYLPDTDEGRAKYLAKAVQIVDEMKKRLDELFLTKPKADIVVKAVEKFRESSAGAAFYQQPASDGSRPGMFYVNLRNMHDQPVYELEALA